MGRDTPGTRHAWDEARLKSTPSRHNLASPTSCSRMDTMTQIRNSRANLAANAKGSKAKSANGVSNMTMAQHSVALQALSNGHAVPYPASLRVVVHEGDHAPPKPTEMSLNLGD